jgi:hypothetical protein
LSRAARPVIESIREGTSRLPQRGGLAQRVRDVNITARVVGSAADATIRITARERRSADLGMLDEGRVRHPTFGGSPWVTQPVMPGWFSGPAQDSEPVFAQAVEEAVDTVIREIDNG